MVEAKVEHLKEVLTRVEANLALEMGMKEEVAETKKKLAKDKTKAKEESTKAKHQAMLENKASTNFTMEKL